MTSFELLNRERKASKLADAIAGAGITSDDLSRFTETTWQLAEKDAGVNPSSRQTRETVAEFLRAREERSTRGARQ